MGLNSDFPQDATTFPAFIVPYKIIATATKEDGSTDDANAETGEILFEVAYTLNCSFSVITLNAAA